MKKLIFALIAMATISFASCAGNATDQQATEENVEIILDTVCPEEPETDTIVVLDSVVSEQPAEATETEVQE